MRRPLALLLPLALSLVGGRPEGPGEVRLEDTLQVLVLDRTLLAVDGTGSELPVALELGERVLHQASQGRVGVALTDRRILAVATGSGSWQRERLRINETVPELPLLGDRVALILTNLRILGFDGGSGNLVEQRLGPHERLLDRSVASSVAVVVTDRRALAVSAFRGGFFEVDLRPDERRSTLKATGTLATLQTPRRLLRFDARTGTWRERPRILR